MEHTTGSRVLACLHGIATGDAVGKQTENLSRDDVQHWYPNGVRGFEGPLGTIIPRYQGNKKHVWLFGETTDDTERTLAVARAIIRDGAVTHTSVGRELLTCRKCVHPGIRSLWQFHESGEPSPVVALPRLPARHPRREGLDESSPLDEAPQRGQQSRPLSFA